MRTRSPRSGSIVADVSDYLRSQGASEIAAIVDAVNAKRSRRGLSVASTTTVRGQLNSNVVGKGHELFERKRRGLYVIAEARLLS